MIIDAGLFISDVLGEASDIAMQHFGNVRADKKQGDNNQIRTEADLAIGAHIIKRIKTTYPDSNIIDEEAGVIDKGSRFTWVIDPIDGTSNFATGSPLFGILLGLLDGDTPVAGGIALPYFTDLYVAVKGQGATKNGKSISIPPADSLLDALVAYGIDGHQEAPEITIQETALLAQIILACRNIRTSNSVFDMAQTIQGTYGVALNRTSKIWDNVAQHILIEEAGGVYTDFFGKPMDYSNPLSKVNQNFSSCAGNKTLHAAMQRLLQSVNRSIKTPTKS